MAVLSLHIVAPVPLMQDRAPAVDVPALIEAVVRCLLEKDAKKRYANARAFIEAVESAAAGCGIDLGAGVPNAPSSPGPAPLGGSERAPASSAWVDKDAFAKTSFGVPAPNATTQSAPREGVFSTLSKQPRGVLLGLAAALPIGFILVVVIAVLAFRGPKHGPNGARSETKDEKAQAAKITSAPPDRVAAAVALGAGALEDLVKEYPDDTSLLGKLATAYQAEGKNSDAMRVVRALLTVDPSAARDDDLVQLVATTATKGQGTDDDEAYALLEGPLGERGVDALIELTARPPGRDGRDARDHRARAAKSLAKPDVRAHASAAAAVYLDLKSAQSCTQKKELLSRVQEEGDARTLPLLKQLKATRGCGFFNRSDCWPCLRREPALEDATTAVESRATPK
jgi:serine/threonine-protein kinase